MPTTITNDLQIYSGGTFQTPSNIQVYSGNTLVSAQNVYVRDAGNWVQVWPPISSNVSFPAFTPEYVFIGSDGSTDDVYYANLTTNTWSYIGRSGFVSTDRTMQRPLGDTADDLIYTTFTGGTVSGTPTFSAYTKLNTTVANATIYKDPVLEASYNVGSGYQITDYTIMNLEVPNSNPNDYPTSLTETQIRWCTNTGNIHITSNIAYDPAYYNTAFNVWPASFSYTVYPCVVVPLTCQDQGEVYFGNSGACVLKAVGEIADVPPFQRTIKNYNGTAATYVASNNFAVVSLGLSYNFTDCTRDYAGGSWIVGRSGALVKIGWNTVTGGPNTVLPTVNNYTGTYGSTNLTHVHGLAPPFNSSLPLLIVLGENGLAAKINVGLYTSTITTGTSNTLRCVAHKTKSSDEIIIAGDGDVILKSTDAGVNWTKFGSPFSVNWKAVYPYRYPGWFEDQAY